MEILVARYQAQEKYLLRQIAWKFLLRVIKPRKILASKNSVEILVARYQAQKKITVNKIAWKFRGAHCSTSPKFPNKLRWSVIKSVE